MEYNQEIKIKNTIGEYEYGKFHRQCDGRNQAIVCMDKSGMKLVEMSSIISITFEKEKEDIINNLSKFIEQYDKFTKMVSPKNWRTTGRHFSELKNILSDIERLNEITDEEKK